jgi:predicted TIM-barrel enzyme
MKIQAMKLALGDSPLAIASGITPENIRRYLPHADAFLVATGISRSFTELDPEKLKTLMRHVNSNGDTPL